jgi:HEPN domain-containing protein
MRGDILVWWEQAKADMKTADVTFEGKRYYASVFFAQQSVEKALKALLLKRIKNPQAPEMTSHSLIFLGKANHIPESFHSFLRDLTGAYTASRYPAGTEEPPEALYDDAIASRLLAGAKEVLEWTGKRL